MAFLAPVLVLGLVILVHEAGHFWAAKLFGVYAPRFAIGFGPTLWRKRWGETEYVLGALPLGGYVRMATREDEASTALEGELTESKGGEKEPLDPDAMIPFGPKPVPPDRWFESKPLWQRAIILLAGVTMNVVLAITVASTLALIYGQSSNVRPVLAMVVPGKPAAVAGMQAGDSISTVDGRAVTKWSDVVSTISAAPSRDVALGVVRSGSTLTLHVIPDTASEQDPVSGATRQVGRIGVQATADPIGIPSAIVMGTSVVWNMGSSVVQLIGGLVTGQVSVKTLGGPIAIVRTSVVVARTGIENLFELIAFLSINLAILNLVPIPLLDGGQLVMQTVETIRGKAFGDRTREWIARFGLGAIAALFLTVTFNDIKNLVMTWVK